MAQPKKEPSDHRCFDPVRDRFWGEKYKIKESIPLNPIWKERLENGEEKYRAKNNLPDFYRDNKHKLS